MSGIRGYFLTDYLQVEILRGCSSRRVEQHFYFRKFLEWRCFRVWGDRNIHGVGLGKWHVAFVGCYHIIIVDS